MAVDLHYLLQQAKPLENMLGDVECAKKVLNRYRSIQPFGGSPLLGESVFGVVSCMQNSLKECMRAVSYTHLTLPTTPYV